MFFYDRRLRKRVEQLFHPPKSKKIYFYSFLCLLITITLWFWDYKSTTKTIGVYLQSKQDLLNPIYSTPVAVSDSIIAASTSSGTLVWYDVVRSKILNKISLNEQVIAPLTAIDINKDSHPEVLLATLNKGYVIYESSGEYLYKSRIESPIKSIIAKPLIFQHEQETYLLLVDQTGAIELVHSDYAQRIWQFDLKLKANEEIIASPILHSTGKHLLVFLTGSKGSCFSINPLTGRIYWQTELKSGFISTGVVTTSRANKPIWSLVDLSGNFNQLNGLNGNKLRALDLKSPSTSSLAAFKQGSDIHFVCLSKNGSVKIVENNRYKTIYSSSLDGPFQASPILTHLNDDSTLDLIVVHSSGKIVFIDVKGVELAKPFYLNSEVTSTPLLIHQKNYLLVAGENGKILTLVIQKNNKRFNHLQTKDDYLEFLHNPDNNYFIK